MLIRVGCEFAYECQFPVPTVALVEVHPQPDNTVQREMWESTPHLDTHTYNDAFGNRMRRLILPAGTSTLRYDATVEVSGDPDPVVPDARQLPVEDLPDEILVYTLASRYCPTEQLSQVAWNLFGWTTPGWSRVQAICDWLHLNIRYGGLYSTPTTTAVDAYVAGGGMCRDFAHLAVTFCRALNIPARYVFGYMPEFRPPEESSPMDFHAWFEAYLDGRWWTFDARFNTPLMGRIPIGFGRDAVDVAMVTTWGAAQFKQMTVWTDTLPDDGSGSDGAVHQGTQGEPSEALRMEKGNPHEEAATA